MKRVLLFVIPVLLLTLSACIAAVHFTEPDEEPPTETQIAAQESPRASMLPSAQESAQEREITLTFDFGERTGVYSGGMTDGLPDGYGMFNSRNAQGVGWVYEGGWSMGHMQGEGTTTWEMGRKETGWYESDYLNGQGRTYQDERLVYEGAYVLSVPEGQGTLYTCSGETIYAGNFTQGYIDETKADRRERMGAFKQQCETPDYSAMMESGQNSGSLRAQVSGTVYYLFDSDNAAYDNSFVLELSGGNLVCVSYLLSVGERPVAAGDQVTVWGMADDIYDYETGTGASVTMPLIEAWDARNITGTPL